MSVCLHTFNILTLIVFFLVLLYTNVQTNIIITVFCCLDTQNVAVPVFGVIILLPVLLQFSGGVLYMYLVAPLKMLFGSRKDKDEAYNALFEERFNARVKKKKKSKQKSDEEAAPGTRRSSTGFIRRANSMDTDKKPGYDLTDEIIEEEIDSDEEAELQKQYHQALLAHQKKKSNGHGNGHGNGNGNGNGNVRRSLSPARQKLNGVVEGGAGAARNASSLGRVEKPSQGHHKNRFKH
jgi:hypothetical protein